MALFSSPSALVFTFGILGNLVSFLVYISPLPTFYRVVKKKSTEGFQSVPYVAALFSAMLWIYYASVKVNETLLITINSVGCVIETIYLAIYIAYAPKNPRILTAKLLFLSLGGFASIVILTRFLSTGSKRVEILGLICMTMSASVYIAPLIVIKQVIRTKSVEFMPFWLSFTLGLSAIMWFFYGMLLRDFYVMIPNVVGLVFALLQMGLYIIYKQIKGSPAAAAADQKLPTSTNFGLPCNIKTTIEIHPVCSLPIQDETKKEETIDSDPTETPDSNSDEYSTATPDCRNVPDQAAPPPAAPQVVVCG